MKCPPDCTCGRHTHSGGGRSRTNAEISKESLHRRVRKLRGRAAEFPCIDCGKPARDWSQIAGTSGTDLEKDYVPRCRPCHFAYDRDLHFNEDTLRRWREGFMKHWTPERRAEYSARMKYRRNHGDLKN